MRQSYSTTELFRSQHGAATLLLPGQQWPLNPFALLTSFREPSETSSHSHELYHLAYTCTSERSLFV